MIQVQNDIRTNKLDCALHLAKGSFGTARDLGILLTTVNPEMAEEFKHLALNFQRIAELLEECSVESIRDYFAGQAMAAILTHRDAFEDAGESEVARMAYNQADAMLEIRAERAGGAA